MDKPLTRLRAAMAWAGILSAGEVDSCIRDHRAGRPCYTEAIWHCYGADTSKAIMHAFRCRQYVRAGSKRT